MTPRALPLLALIFALPVGTGCKDEAKASEQNATRSVVTMTKLVNDDVQELARGMPDGAKQLVSLYAAGADPGKDLPALRLGLRKIRGEVPDLTRSKATFFALT